MAAAITSAEASSSRPSRDRRRQVQKSSASRISAPVRSARRPRPPNAVREVKGLYDPSDLFKGNHHIPPAELD